MKRFALVGILLGCGGPQDTPPINAPIAVASVAPTAPVVVKTTLPDATQRSPSRELVRRWPIKDSAYVVIYADFGSFTGTELGRAVGKEMASAFKSPDATKCFAGVLSLKELAFGVDHVGGVVVARFDKDPTADLETCMSAIESEYAPMPYKNATKAWSSQGSELLVVDGKFVVFGSQELVERALLAESPDEGVLATMRLPSDQFVSWVGHEGNFEAHGGLFANGERAFASAEIDFEDVERAARMERNQSPTKLARDIGRSIERFDKSAWPIVNRIAGEVTMKRDEKHLTFAFESPGAASEQAKDLGALGALGVRTFEHEIGEHRGNVARNGLWKIEQGLRQYLLTAKQKKLVSIGPTPKTVPKGIKVKTTDADWKAWSAVSFKIEAPLRYQFEVKASKAGDTAEILARGDFDGNGKASLYKMTVKVDATGALESMGQIEETDPLE